jgi:hypothetical protein
VNTLKPSKAIVVEANWRDNPWFPQVLEDALSGFLIRRNSSTASDLRRGFQHAHNSLSGARIVGRNSVRLLALSAWASSTQARLKPSSDLIDSAV